MIVELQEISKVIMGQSPKGESYNDEKIGLPLLNGAADYKGKVFKPKYYTSEPTRTAKKGDILLGVRATIGNFTFSDNEYCIGRGVAAIRVDENKADKGYVIKCVEKGLNEIIHTLSGSTIKGIRKEDLTEMKLNLPPLPQQKKIANILDAADALRQNDKALIAKYDELTQALFLDMFGDPVSNPKGCKIVELGDICSKITDGVHAKPEYTETGVPFISVKDITTGVLKFEKCKYISEEAHIKYYKRCNPEYLDILYTKVGATYGRPAIVDVKDEFSLYVSVALIKPKKDIINPYFLKEVMGNPVIKRQADKSIKGIGVPDLHLNMIKKFLLPLPPMETQILFSERVGKIEEQRAIAQKSLVKSEELFNSLLQKAFKGELV